MNFYALNTGAVNKVLENQIDNSSGFPIVHELYSPGKDSPDGNQLLINISFYEAGTYGIYLPTNNALVRFNRPDVGSLFWPKLTMAWRLRCKNGACRAVPPSSEKIELAGT